MNNLLTQVAKAMRPPRTTEPRPSPRPVEALRITGLPSPGLQDQSQHLDGYLHRISSGLQRGCMPRAPWPVIKTLMSIAMQCRYGYSGKVSFSKTQDI
jgi:hypothetical protein